MAYRSPGTTAGKFITPVESWSVLVGAATLVRRVLPPRATVSTPDSTTIRTLPFARYAAPVGRERFLTRTRVAPSLRFVCRRSRPLTYPSNDPSLERNGAKAP